MELFTLQNFSKQNDLLHGRKRSFLAQHAPNK